MRAALTLALALFAMSACERRPVNDPFDQACRCGADRWGNTCRACR